MVFSVVHRMAFLSGAFFHSIDSNVVFGIGRGLRGCERK